jgi:hypothetical protein
MKCSTKCEPEFSNQAAAFDRLSPGKRRQNWPVKRGQEARDQASPLHQRRREV